MLLGCLYPAGPTSGNWMNDGRIRWLVTFTRPETAAILMAFNYCRSHCLEGALARLAISLAWAFLSISLPYIIASRTLAFRHLSGDQWAFCL
ncbi:hypothetical protein N7474_006080 [Penicillium riverlandense]|uniref:uncharacterized protein n=1 Tax=Penicillium riverlandense TaxID=1903569 RepID=UPI0025469758|nr:uncharacterized protein N7474_006080 [Penicillium riverlandense]KAJ5820489.1 hypothetical protein N7474_006080 [Penicillium riverlandense]